MGAEKDRETNMGIFCWFVGKGSTFMAHLLFSFIKGKLLIYFATLIITLVENTLSI